MLMINANDTFNVNCKNCNNSEICKYKDDIEKKIADIENITNQSDIIFAKVTCIYFNGKNDTLRVFPN